MPFSIQITTSGIDKTIGALKTAAMGLRDHRGFLKEEVQPLLKKEFTDVFRSRGYRKWRPLAASTLREKAEAGYPSAPLVRTRNYSRQSAQLRGMSIRRNVLEIVSPIPYAKYHEFGTRRIPARPVFISVADRIRNRLPDLYVAYARRKHLRELQRNTN